MVSLLFSAQGRINRAKVWLAVLIYLVVSAIVGGLTMLLVQMMPGAIKPDGSFNVTGLDALPYLILIFGYIIFCIWSGICIGIKRYHDRNKSGVWILIQLVPVIGPFWYFIEVMCLRGTVGPNQYGPDPLGYDPQTLPGAGMAAR